VRGELGRFPIIHDIIKSVMRYYGHISKNSSQSIILKNALAESKSIDSCGTFSWFSYVKNMSKLFDINLENVAEGTHVFSSQMLKESFTSFWSEHFVSKYKNDNCGKFNKFVLYKTHFKYEKYLDDITNRRQRVALTRFRISSHRLKIETGRYAKPIVPRENRFCDFCLVNNKNCVQDEVHFLLECPKFEKERHVFIEKTFSSYPSTKLLSKPDLFTYLMSSEGEIIDYISKFCANNL
ncbi:MAG: hypothetical protein MJA29_01100, partial [Candidatus Omnitrophica bacterium]|nr:hypothetical protein [Candidatus Omnitrophota bacterium]